MDYKQEWIDMKKWLKKSIDYYDKDFYETTQQEELKRLSNKANTFRLVLNRMNETEKMNISIAEELINK